MVFVSQFLKKKVSNLQKMDAGKSFVKYPNDEHNNNNDGEDPIRIVIL